MKHHHWIHIIYANDANNAIFIVVEEAKEDTLVVAANVAVATAAEAANTTGTPNKLSSSLLSSSLSFEVLKLSSRSTT